MKKFNVIIWNVNARKFESYDIIPYLIDCYQKSKTKPKTFDEFKEFIKKNSMYQWWSRCEYEIILKDWPNGTTESKIDIYQQVMMNIDIITEIITNEVCI